MSRLSQYLFRKNIIEPQDTIRVERLFYTGHLQYTLPAVHDLEILVSRLSYAVFRGDSPAERYAFFREREAYILSLLELLP